MKQKIVGSYSLGNESVQLVAREGTGGDYYTQPEKAHIARIKVGMDYKASAWEEVVNALLHESLELSIDRHNARHRPTNDISYDHSNYIFVFNHPQFSDIVAKTAEFITPALPDLARTFKAWHKKPAKKKPSKSKKSKQ